MTLTEEIMQEALRAPEQRKREALKVLRGEGLPAAFDPLADLISTNELMERFNLKSRQALYRLRLPVVMKIGGVNYYRRSTLHKHFPPHNRMAAVKD